MELRLENVSKHYGAKRALQSVSLSVSEGIYALLGPNGAGKTTMMHLITDVLTPTCGRICYNSQPIEMLGTSYREKIGFLPQEPGFYPHFSGEKMLRYFACLKGVLDEKSVCEALLHQTNLWDCRKRKVGGYSGGMKRRLGIAIALLGNPEILVLDEPTAGLDPKERIRFRNLIHQISKNRIVIYSTHIISDISSIADRIILLKNGMVECVKTPDELCSMLSGKVWEAIVPTEQSDTLLSHYCVTGFTTKGNRSCFRMISDQKPVSNATEVSANLEDVYLYYFGGDSHDAI